MPKQNQQRKKERQTNQHFSDPELIAIFLRGKDKEVTSPHLRIRKAKPGLNNLLYRDTGNPVEKLFCQLGNIQRQGEGIKKILLIEPKNGTPALIRVVFGGFSANSIFWFYQFTPLTVDDALSIYRESKNEGTIFDNQPSTDRGNTSTGEVIL